MLVYQLIEQLQFMPQDLPVMFANTGSRYNEYSPVDRVELGHLKNQNTDGDPEHYWLDPEEADEEGFENEINELVLIKT